jgi:hypothetical protein
MHSFELILKIILLKVMTLVGHAASTGEKRNIYRILKYATLRYPTASGLCPRALKNVLEFCLP